MKIPRVFIPLSKAPYEWFKEGNKKWELRRYGRQYTEKNIKKNRIVELRCGYSNKEKSIWGIITDYYINDKLENIFRRIDYHEIIPSAINISDATEKTKAILNIDNIDNKFIAFKVFRLNEPQFIEINDEYLNIIKNGQKKSTIRKGIRNYEKGVCIAYSEKNSIVFNIENIKIKSFSQITECEAIKDGFNSIFELKEKLEYIYGELDKNQIMTIIEFNKIIGEY